MLALLHTAHVHVASFARLARELDPSIPIRHEVRADLLADTVAGGTLTEAVRSGIADTIQRLAHEGAKVIVCTCSTIGGAAEAVPIPSPIRVLRIDRPMAEQAVGSNRRILLCAALRSTFAPTLALLREVATRSTGSLDVVEVFCEGAWPHFERGDHAAYYREVALTIESMARPTDLVLLAQASMAPVAELVAHLNIPVLSSPKLGLERAMSLHRTLSQ